MNPVAHRRAFEHLPDFEQQRYAELLRQLKRLKLPCRCERVGNDFQVIVGYGLPTATFWMDMYGIPDEDPASLT